MMKVDFDNSDSKAELNQYWYSPKTIATLLSEIQHHAMSCAFLSTPSLFFALDHRNGDEDDATDEQLRRLRSNSRLFEFDPHWEKDPGFVKYDFHYPERIPIQYMNAFDYVVADPPFITSDVWEAYMITTKLILKEGGKVLFTTILENHTMLEGKWGGPLFIARFFPLVRKLTYQYVCFTSYEATRLRAANEELPPESPKLLAAIEMANSLRESEEAFMAQMAERRREGEQPLPTTAFERDSCEGTAAPPAPSRVGLTAEQLAQIPIKDLEWNYVPEGLSMYPEGQTGVLKRDEAGNPENGFHPTNGCPTLEEQQDYGPIYALCVDLRQNLETFKNHIDALQRLLDLQMRLRHQRLRVRKELMGQTAGDKQQGEEANPPVGDTKPCSPTEDPEDALRELDRQVQEAEAERQAKVDHMAVLAGTIAAQEAKLHFLKAQDTAQAGSIQTPANGSSNLGCDAGAEPSFRLPYEPTMQACIAAYRTVVVKKAPLQELAAVATGSYKYPLFGRMRELLREMKEIKKQKNEDPHA
ncbi:unnamed protein product [Phytomonas sp. EM1]|nr:unnamed protein product [Phytomonas sp. EM1]|eukprot:CCW63958.1 unnamed protein product [Phytomonas sp. isolate EM1]